MKHINVIYMKQKDGNLTEPPKELHKKNFASYAAVARALKVGQTAVIEVSEGTKQFMIKAGYGEVTKDSATSYTCPRRLQYDY